MSGRYTIVREVGSGTFGTVFLAKHALLGHSVALKVLNQRFLVDDATRARFNREAQASAAIDHPGIVDILDADITEQGIPFVAMEWLDGETLRERHRRQRPQLNELVAVFEELLEALAAAHEQKFVHRDLKPENVFLSHRPDGKQEVKLLDFGLARQQDDATVTESGTSLGTPQYMAPEQVMDARQVTPAADVWAIGVMLYEVLSGELPFQSPGSKHALMLQIMTKDHRPLAELAPKTPRPLVSLVERCMKKEPTQRYQDASALLAALRYAAGQLNLPAFDVKATVREIPVGMVGEVPPMGERPAADERPAVDLPPSPYAPTGPAEAAPKPSPRAQPSPAPSPPPGKLVQTAACAAREVAPSPTAKPASRPAPVEPAVDHDPKSPTRSAAKPRESARPLRAEPERGPSIGLMLALVVAVLGALAAAAVGGYLLYDYYQTDIAAPTEAPEPPRAPEALSIPEPTTPEPAPREPATPEPEPPPEVIPERPVAQPAVTPTEGGEPAEEGEPDWDDSTSGTPPNLPDPTPVLPWPFDF